MYDFNKQFGLGQIGERLVAHAMKNHIVGLRIKESSREQQRIGIDQIWNVNGNHYNIEIKTDIKAAKTGNLYIETISVENEYNHKLGWSKTSQADICLTYIPGENIIFATEMVCLKSHVVEWFKDVRVKTNIAPVQNKGYVTKGIAVPLDVFMEANTIKIMLHSSYKNMWDKLTKGK